MKTPILSIASAFISVSFLFCTNLAQAVQPNEVGPNYVIFKEIKSNQAGPGTGNIMLGNNPYRFDVLVQAVSDGSLTGGNVSLAAGSSASSPETLTQQDDGVINAGTFATQDTFTDQSTLDTNYADGTYGLHLTGASSTTYNASLSLTGDGYPSATPNITNTNWIDGVLVVDPTADFTVTWDAFAGSTASDRIGVGVGRIQDSTATFQVLPASATSVTFPADYFDVDGSYRVHIVFLKVSATDTADISGSTGFGGFAKETRVIIQTTGTNNGNVANISTRSFVQTGDNVMIAGIIVHDDNKKIIVRAVGPSLSSFGIADPLSDPTLTLYDINNNQIATNDDWQTTQIGGIITSDQSADIQNSGHAPGNSKESAIIATLPAGQYTAIVRGVGGSTGVALVEVYTLQ